MLEELGSDAHVFFNVDARADHRRGAGSRLGRQGSLPDERALFTARVDARTAARVGARLELAVDPARFHFFDPDTRRAAEPQPARPARGRRVTKQRETRERVLELIEPLERRRRDPLRAPARHRPRRLAADRARGARRARARGLPRSPPRRRHVRRRAEGREGHRHHLVQRRHARSAASRRRAARSTCASIPAGARLGRILHVSPSEQVLSVKRLRLADGEPMAIELLHVRAVARAGPDRRRSRGELLLRPARRPLRDLDRRRHADRRADGHERGGVGRRSACRSTRPRCSSSA